VSNQLRFFARRLLMLAATLLVASFVIFGSLYLAPGNPIAVLSGGRSLPPDAIKILEHRYHLDQPFLVQYWIWLTNAMHGDLGISILLREDVSTLIAQRAGGTAALVLYSAVLIVIIGVGLGLIGGLRPGWIDTSVIIVSAVSAALPSFVAAIVLIFVFSVGLGWFPSLGSGEGIVDGIYHLTLPAFALAAAQLAIVARVTRTAVREEFGREHVQTAISRGIPYPALVRRHVLRNAAIPITTVTGVTIASLIAAAAVVERAFGLNGLGSYLVSAANSKDFAVVQGISLMLVVTFVIVNLVTDLLYAALDPRISLGSRAQ
jgi:peptide/nickel transport system permease protein